MPTRKIHFNSNLVIQTILSVIWPKSRLRSYALTILSIFSREIRKHSNKYVCQFV